MLVRLTFISCLHSHEHELSYSWNIQGTIKCLWLREGHTVRSTACESSDIGRHFTVIVWTGCCKNARAFCTRVSHRCCVYRRNHYLYRHLALQHVLRFQWNLLQFFTLIFWLDWNKLRNAITILLAHRVETASPINWFSKQVLTI